MKTDLKSMCVLVTPTSFARNEPGLKAELESQIGKVVYNSFGRPLESHELIDLIQNVDGYIAGLDRIDRNVISSADRLKVIARYGVGVDNIDLDAAKQNGIVVTNTPGANSASVAELTIGLILALARNITEAVLSTRMGNWPRLDGISLVGKTIGLIGFGSIGKEVARRLSCFDCQLIACDVFPDLEAAQKLNVRICDLTELLPLSDFISLHLPLLPDTKKMVNHHFLEQMKKEAFLINTARGDLIDETALYDALKSGNLQGAALDVFCNQPPGVDHLLLSLPQVIATPHIGAHTDGSVSAMGWGALSDCLAVLKGETPLHRVV